MSLLVLGRRANANRICGGEPNVIERAARRTTVPTSLASSTARWFNRLGRAQSVTGRHSAQIAIGDPVREIIKTAMEHEAPLVVVGLRGADEAPPGSIGSVARELMTRGPMPVLAVNAL